LNWINDKSDIKLETRSLKRVHRLSLIG